MAIGTNEIKAVLEGWADNFLEDVPAVHRGGEYLIEYTALLDYIHSLDSDNLVDILEELEMNYL